MKDKLQQIKEAENILSDSGFNIQPRVRDVMWRLVDELKKYEKKYGKLD